MAHDVRMILEGEHSLTTSFTIQRPNELHARILDVCHRHGVQPGFYRVRCTLDNQERIINIVLGRRESSVMGFGRIDNGQVGKQLPS